MTSPEAWPNNCNPNISFSLNKFRVFKLEKIGGRSEFFRNFCWMNWKHRGLFWLESWNLPFHVELFNRDHAVNQLLLKKEAMSKERVIWGKFGGKDKKLELLNSIPTFYEIS